MLTLLKFMAEKFFYQKFRNDAQRFVEHSLSEGKTPFGILTGTVSINVVTLLDLLRLNRTTINDVEQAMLFELKVAEILFPQLTETERTDFVIARGDRNVGSTEKTSTVNALEFLRRKQREQLEPFLDSHQEKM